jgi:hypothetical protein
MDNGLYNKDNLPNASKVIDSLRMVGYDNISAIADLVDNSIDAGAKRIQIQIKPDLENYTIYIADNGTGMPQETLDEALKLGSNTTRDEEADLGKFGMGLITASLSLCKKLTVITKTEGGEVLTSIQDIDVIKEENKFVKVLREATKKETQLFNSFLLNNNSDSGTLLILSKCDQVQDKNIETLIKTLKQSIGQIFRLFIDSGREIYIANEKIKALDPLMLNNKDTKVVSDETFAVVTEEGNKEKIQVKIIMLPNIPTSDTGKLNIRNQGFYLMRNNREIAEALTLDIFSKHNDYNRFRGEIYFTGTLDNDMRIEFTKRDLKPKQNILHEIKKITLPQLQYFRKEIKREQRRHKDKEEIHEESAKSIKEKSTLLIKPEVKIEKRSSPKEKGETNNKKGEGKNLRRPVNVQNLRKANTNVAFQVRDMTTNGPLFDADQIGRKTLITYNSDHPFYLKVFVENDNDYIKTYIDYMTYSLATAKLKAFDDDQIERIENYMSIFSSNLRVLMR